MAEEHNFRALVSSLLAFIGFIFLPWVGTQFTSAGSIIFTDTLYGTVGAIKDPHIWIIMIGIPVALVASIWGIFKPESGMITYWICFAAGLFSFVYFVNVFLLVETDPSKGLGFWAALLGTIGLLLQPISTTRFPRFGLPIPNSIRKSSLQNKIHAWTPFSFLLPGLILYGMWIIAPSIYTFYMSLLRWDFISTPVFVGLQNYRELFTRDPDFILALTNNLRWLVVFLTLPTLLGLFLALILNNEVFGGRLFKVSFYFPLVLSMPVIGLVWAWFYNPSDGLINSLLSLLGVQHLPGWLADRKLAIWAIIIAAVWRQTGYVMVLYLAGLKSIDPQLLDAAQVDGTNRFQLIRYVILPLLTPVTIIIVVISIIDSLRAFDLVSIMTRGGQNTQVLANKMYMETFNNYQMGYGAAIAVVLFLICLVFILTYLRSMIRNELEY